MNKIIKLSLYLLLLLFSNLCMTASISLNPAIEYQTMHGWETTDFSGYTDIPEAGFIFATHLGLPADNDNIPNNAPINPYHIFASLDTNNNLIPNNVVTDTLLTLANGLAELGINRIRFETASQYERPDFNASFKDYHLGNITRNVYKANRYDAVNDNNDPFNINWNGFSFDELDFKIDTVINPMRQALAARGENLYILLTYVDFKNSSSTSGFEHLFANPEEYAEYILAHFIHMNNKYGFVPDAVEMKLEPDIGLNITAAQLTDAQIATSQRLTNNGFTGVEFIAPSNTRIDNAITFINEMILHDSTVLNYLSELSYHAYTSADNLTNRQTIASLGNTHGLRTAQLEFWNLGAGQPGYFQTLDFIFNHITQANNSAYQYDVNMGFSLSSNTTSVADLNHISMAPFELDIVYDENTTGSDNRFIKTASANKSWAYWYIAQFTKYIKRGSIRFDSNSDDADVRVMSFVNTDGSYTIVLKTTAAKSFNISGLLAGTYEITYVTGNLTITPTSGDSSNHQITLNNQTILNGQTLATNIPDQGVMTITGLAINEVIFTNGFE